MAKGSTAPISQVPGDTRSPAAEMAVELEAEAGMEVVGEA